MVGAEQDLVAVRGRQRKAQVVGRMTRRMQRDHSSERTTVIELDVRFESRDRTLPETDGRCAGGRLQSRHGADMIVIPEFPINLEPYFSYQRHKGLRKVFFSLRP